MWMEFQGKKATHDFLSLYTKDSSLQLQDSRPPSQGFYLKTHDFLKPLEKSEEPELDPAPGPTDRAASVAHVLPGGIGTYSITHVADGDSPAVVKPEVVTCARGPGLASKPESDSGFGSYAGMAFALWDASSTAAKNGGLGGQWPSTFATSTTASFSSRNHPAQDKKRLVESGSRSSRGFDEDDEDDDEFGKREGTSKKVELTVRVDGKGGNEQKPTTPRSKHSATEQRRRSKINDRFQILRELIPHSDQKRDKASFLLEVIEYIRFLQEKVQKPESSYVGWGEENTKLMPWINNQVARDGTATDPSQAIKNGHAPGLMSSIDGNRATESATSPGVPCRTTENPVGFSNKASSAPISSQPKCASVERGIGVAQPQPRSISDVDNMASQSQSRWLRPSGPADCSVETDTPNDQEELVVDEGTINISSAYSQNVLNALNRALESSGLDLSRASISVRINLGKRATRRRVTTTTTMSSAKEIDHPLSKSTPAIGRSRVGSSGEEFEESPKRRRSENS